MVKYDNIKDCVLWSYVNLIDKNNVKFSFTKTTLKLNLLIIWDLF